MPYIPWDEDTKAVTPNKGYCTHDSLLFPCWHRPYMMLFEVSLAGAAVKSNFDPTWLTEMNSKCCMRS